MKLTSFKSFIEHIRSTLPTLPDAQFDSLVKEYGVSLKDAKTLCTLDNGARVDFFHEIVQILSDQSSQYSPRVVGKTAINW